MELDRRKGITNICSENSRFLPINGTNTECRQYITELVQTDLCLTTVSIRSGTRLLQGYNAQNVSFGCQHVHPHLDFVRRRTLLCTQA